MKFEKLKNIDKHDWCIRIGDTSGNKPFCINIRHFTKHGCRLTINLYHDRLISLFGFNQKIFGA